MYTLLNIRVNEQKQYRNVYNKRIRLFLNALFYRHITSRTIIFDITFKSKP